VGSEGSPRDAETDIRSVIEAWAIWRDSGAWEELRSTWAANGRMNTTWFRGSASDFIQAAREAFMAGTLAHHFLGGSVVYVAGRRATAQTRVTISQRLMLTGTEVDVTCVAVFFDFFAQHEQGWQLVLREPVYEKDRLDSVVPGEVPALDHEVLASLPQGCRHLLYCQMASGLRVRADVLTAGSEGLARLHLDAQDWLAGKELSR
jgi:hypothetical protein